MTLEADRRAALLDWYASDARDLPWRANPTPYRVLVSEVMLQQTQVDRVIPFFDRFMEAWPTIQDLAAAPLSQVLEMWSGLGYNNRAKRLHDAAGAVTEDGWPDTVAGLQQLPGIGPYTARAIGAFAFGWRTMPVDTNIRRVMSRWHGEPLDGAALQGVAEKDSGGDSAAFAQAVMDLGARLCRPRNPSCDRCPVASWCAGPDTYVPPRPQSKFEGSARQLRGAIMRALVRSPAGLPALVEETGFTAAEVEKALADLTAEGLVTASEGDYRLPGN